MKSPPLRLIFRIASLALGLLSIRATQAQSTPPASVTPAATTISATDPILHGQIVNAMPTNPNLHTVWIIGDSTIRNGVDGNGDEGNLWGWGAPMEYYIDRSKINVVNRAYGGTSSRSFYNAQWKRMVDLIKKGDIVIMQFGANDNGTPATGKTAIKGNGDETQEANGETIHTFGWYMKQYVTETRAKGATPIICSLTPRENWLPDGHFRRDNTTHVAWAAQAAKESNALYIDLYELIARRYEQLGKEKVLALYGPLPTEHLHTGWYGAVVNAECVISGLKALKDDPLADYFTERGQAVPMVDTNTPAPEPVKIADPASTTPATSGTSSAVTSTATK